MPTAVADYKRVFVQYCSAWVAGGSHEASWVTAHDLIPQRASEQFSNQIGSATLVRYCGTIRTPYGTDEERHPSASSAGGAPNYIGSFVRLVCEAAGGAVTIALPASGGNVSCTAFWWGVIKGRTLTPGQVGLVETYDCVGILYLLDQLALWRGYEKTSGTDYADPGLLPFNAEKRGDRAATETVSAGLGAPYIHDRSEDAEQWSALDAVEHVLYTAQAQINAGDLPEIALSASSLLVFYETWEHGASVLETLTRIMSGRRGIGFRATVTSGTVEITPVSLLPSASATVDSQSVAAAASTTTVDLSQLGRGDFTLIESQDATFDRIGVEGDEPVWALTLAFESDGTGALRKGWSASDETAWDAATQEEIDADPALQMVWRRYVLAEDWNGQDYAGTAINQWVRTVATSTLHGTSGETGEMESGGTAPGRRSVRFARALPLWDGYDWTTQDPDTADQTRAAMKPEAYLKEGSSWSRLADELDVEDVRIQVEDDGAAIIIGGPNDADAIATAVGGGSADLAVTIGVVLPQRLRVSWRRDPANRPRNFERSMLVQAPKVRRWVLAKDTVVALDGTAAQTRGGLTPTTILDEVNKLKFVLSLTRWWQDPARSLTWRDASTLDIGSALQCGVLVTSATLPTGIASPTTATFTINEVITSREWDFTMAGYGTTYRTSRITPDLEAIAR